MTPFQERLGGLAVQWMSGVNTVAFRLSHGDGGPSLSIRCADGDSTRACVDAIMPMIERLIPPHAGMTPGQ